MSTADEINIRMQAATRALMDNAALVEGASYICFAHKTIAREIETIAWVAAGGKKMRHGRAAGARGRKARLMAARHPRPLPICRVDLS